MNFGKVEIENSNASFSNFVKNTVIDLDLSFFFFFFFSECILASG